MSALASFYVREPAWAFVLTWLALVLLLVAIHHAIVAQRTRIERRAQAAKLRRYLCARRAWRRELPPPVRFSLSVMRGLDDATVLEWRR